MKKHGVVMLLCLALTAPAGAQNLISNPGFEDGRRDWDELWTRTPNAGTSRIVSSPVHSGAKALQIEHWGASGQDWSLRHFGEYPVTSGEIFEFSARVRVDRLQEWAELSVILYDKDDEVLTWSHGSVYFATTNQTFKEVTSRFIIPDQVSRITPRFIGADTCDVFIDDVRLERLGRVGDDIELTLQNEQLALTLKAPSLEFTVESLASRRRYTAAPVDGFVLQHHQTSGAAILLDLLHIGSNIPVNLEITLQGNHVQFDMDAPDDAKLNALLRFPGIITPRAGDFLAVPWATGMLLPVEEGFPFWRLGCFDWKGTMPFVGVTDLQAGYLLVSDNPWDASFQFLQPNGSPLYAPQLQHHPIKNTWGETRRFHLAVFDEGGYVAMANWYRQHAESLGHVRTFSEKQAANPNMTKLKGAVDFWALHHAFRQPAFIDSLVRFGIDKALISLGGSWYNSRQLAAVIDSINARGLLSSRYDIFTDVWPPTQPDYPWYRTEGYPQDVIVNEDGSLLEGWLAYLDGDIPFQGYYTCSATHPDYARPRLTTDLAKHRYNTRFIDVELSSPLRECYSTVHPTTRRQDGMHRYEALGVVKKEFGLVTGSEEARDFCFPVVDYGEGTLSIMPTDGAGYDWSTPVDKPSKDFVEYNMNAARRIPLHGLVYHDVHVPTWYTGDGLSKVPAYWDDKDVFNILYAAMPLIMPPSPVYWQEHRERFLTSMTLVSAVTRNCGFAKMTDHQFLNPQRTAQQTEFANDWTVTANFSETDFVWQDITLPAKGFYATDGARAVFRKRTDSGQIFAVADLDDRLFLQSYDAPINYRGVRTSGAVLLKKQQSQLELAIIGEPVAVDLHPNQLPWPLQSLAAETIDEKTISLEVLEDGWLRLDPGGERFFKLDGEFITKADEPTQPDQFVLHPNFPNPFNPETTLKFKLAKPAPVTLHIYDMLGRRVRTLVNGRTSAERHQIVWDGRDDSGAPVSSGVYIARLVAGEQRRSIKMMLIQ